METIKVMAASGQLGSGFSEKSFNKGLSWEPDMIGCDSGSTDSGPFYLGSGKNHFPHDAIKRDLRLILLGATQNRIPAIVGSAGTGGSKEHLEIVVNILLEIAKEENLHFKLGIIKSDIEKTYLKKMFDAGKISPLPNAPAIDHATIDSCTNIVGLAGAEPFIDCLDNGCNVIIGGRSSDTSIYAALPLQKGFPPGIVWHAAKILECGAACVTQRKYPDCMFGSIDMNGFSLEPPNPKYFCTPVSVASHMLYENASAFKLIEPSGILDTSKATYRAIDTRSVRVEGSEFQPAERYSVKMEGAKMAGHLSIILGGVRDPVIIRQLDSWLEGMETKVRQRFATIYGNDIDGKYRLFFRVYGKDAVMGSLESDKSVTNEVGIVLEVLADTEELVRTLVSVAAHICVHYPVPEWSGLITGLAYPYSPAATYKGPLYEFTLNHVVYPDSYQDIFKTEYHNI
ncbi:MAG: DUF1446 domain-containing protein [Proteobacteria bacterium]|nr:DUF1446 domain-containing protein [Pseudomonadota bacterium]